MISQKITMGRNLIYDGKWVGKVFGEWTVIADCGTRKNGQHYFRCRCSCGVEREVATHSLNKGDSKSCVACAIHKRSTSCAERNARLVGTVDGKFTIIEKVKYRTGRAFRCRCTCGRERIVAMTTSSGLATKGCSVCDGTTIRHGLSHLTEYKVWSGMKARCLNAKNPHYKRYGGRGITICPEWADSFTAFYESVGPRPSMDLSLDRIDNNGNYEPGNVRWATRKQQRINQRTVSDEYQRGRLDGMREAFAWIEKMEAA